MSITSRQQQILDLLNERSYITVRELSELTFTSASSIRRDLAFLQDNGLLQRTHGGASALEPLRNVASFHDRMKRNVKEKRIIAQKASRFLKDGQTILLDSSSTVQFLLPYIAKHQGITVFTNNLSTAIRSIELGINTHCLGGHSFDGGLVLSGTETYRTLSEITVDILFFSSQSISEEGVISDSTEEENFARKLMLKSSKYKVFLCDNSKFHSSSTYKLCSTGEVDCLVSDREETDLSFQCTLI